MCEGASAWASLFVKTVHSQHATEPARAKGSASHAANGGDVENDWLAMAVEAGDVLIES